MAQRSSFVSTMGILALLIAVSCESPVASRVTGAQSLDSDRRLSVSSVKAGPLYWIAYENPYSTNVAIPQDRFLANVDWIASQFRSFGYRMVATDGWIENSTRTNSQGYITHYNDNWTLSWVDLVNYAGSKGLELGVYYNPLWVTPAAAFDPNKKVVGTNIPVGDIVDKNWVYSGDNPQNLPGDRFGYTFGNGSNTLYWVNTDRPGAKEYIQGYVKYFKDMGVRYLRVDFLSWFEAGTDHGGLIGRNHGALAYEQALAWMAEAAGNDMLLSLVMPNLNNNAQIELKYGDMVRINEDCGPGDWNRFSGLNRGVHFGSWSQWSNAFDGLIYWSKYLGPGRAIADPDMFRLHQLANDDERKSAVSLSIMAGAPVTIADQYDTIGGHAWVYQNPELLALNAQNMVGAPLSSDPNNAYDSQRWIGTLADGTKVVGLFNREETPQWRGVVFNIDLGFAQGDVRDLWAHQDLGNQPSYGLWVPPHGCAVVTVRPTSGGATLPLTNPGFETGALNGWTEWHPVGQAPAWGIDGNDVHSGFSKAYFWSFTPYHQSIHQVRTGLANGSYTVKAWTKQNTGTPTTARLELADYGGTAVYIPIPGGNGYQQIAGTVQVTNGKLDIGFYVHAPGYVNLQIDDVVLVKN